MEQGRTPVWTTQPHQPGARLASVVACRANPPKMWAAFAGNAGKMGLSVGADATRAGVSGFRVCGLGCGLWGCSRISEVLQTDEAWHLAPTSDAWHRETPLGHSYGAPRRVCHRAPLGTTKLCIPDFWQRRRRAEVHILGKGNSLEGHLPPLRRSVDGRLWPSPLGHALSSRSGCRPVRLRRR